MEICMLPALPRAWGCHEDLIALIDVKMLCQPGCKGRVGSVYLIRIITYWAFLWSLAK